MKLDVCSEHGTWFDHGEAWSLIEAMTAMGGAGLDAERNQHAAAWSRFMGMLRSTFR